MTDPAERVEHIDGAFVIGKRAELTYTMTDNGHATLDHTFVDESLRGGGVARRLIDAAVEWARTSNIKLTPVCSYTRAVFARDKSIADVLARD